MERNLSANFTDTSFVTKLGHVNKDEWVRPDIQKPLRSAAGVAATRFDVDPLNMRVTSLALQKIHVQKPIVNLQNADGDTLRTKLFVKIIDPPGDCSSPPLRRILTKNKITLSLFGGDYHSQHLLRARTDRATPNSPVKLASLMVHEFLCILTNVCCAKLMCFPRVTFTIVLYAFLDNAICIVVLPSRRALPCCNVVGIVARTSSFTRLQMQLRLTPS